MRARPSTTGPWRDAWPMSLKPLSMMLPRMVGSSVKRRKFSSSHEASLYGASSRRHSHSSFVDCEENCHGKPVEHSRAFASSLYL